MKLKTKKIFIFISTTLVSLIDLIYAINIYLGIINLGTFNDTFSISNTSQIALLSFCVLLNIISIYFTSKNLLAHKKKLIIFNVILFLIGNIFNIIFSIFNIIVLSIKTKDIEEYKERKELPKLEDITKHKWYTYFLIYVFLFIICYTPIINLLPIPNAKIAVTISIILLYIIQLTLLIIPMWNELKRDFIVFKSNFKLYLSHILPRFGIILIAYFIASTSLITLVGNISSTNQYIISQLPIYISAFVAIIIAPITEELMFRGFMKKFIKNDILFILLSSLIFGFLHVALESNISQFLFIIPYSILGFAFSYNYVKTRNIASNIFLHSAWNSIAIIALIITKFMNF